MKSRELRWTSGFSRLTFELVLTWLYPGMRKVGHWFYIVNLSVSKFKKSVTKCGHCFYIWYRSVSKVRKSVTKCMEWGLVSRWHLGWVKKHFFSLCMEWRLRLATEDFWNIAIHPFCNHGSLQGWITRWPTFGFSNSSYITPTRFLSLLNFSTIDCLPYKRWTCTACSDITISCCNKWNADFFFFF